MEMTACFTLCHRWSTRTPPCFFTVSVINEGGAIICISWSLERRSRNMEKQKNTQKELLSFSISSTFVLQQRIRVSNRRPLLWANGDLQQLMYDFLLFLCLRSGLGFGHPCVCVCVLACCASGTLLASQHLKNLRPVLLNQHVTLQYPVQVWFKEQK